MQVEKAAFDALGTTCEVLAVGAPAERLERATRWIQEMHLRLSRFLPGSELSRFNSAAGERRADISPDLEAVLREALRGWEVSGGLVHAAVLPALRAAGYTRPLREGVTAARPLSPHPLPDLPDLLTIGRGWGRLRAGAAIDLGGIAKGWLADRVSSWVGENCVVNLGGDLFALGEGPNGGGWPVGFGGRTVLLSGAGAATSSTQRRRWGDGLHHLIDPRTGLPAQSDLGQVSVLASSARDAEIAAKTALLLGSRQAPTFLVGRTLGWWLN
jgi:thiamine biosynthesis lipoprotein